SEARRRGCVAGGRASRGASAQRPRGPRGSGCYRTHRAGVARHRARIRRCNPGAHMKLDAVGLEVMAHAFASIAEEMGLVLVHSALSPNIRERRDASPALFDAEVEMMAEAQQRP